MGKEATQEIFWGKSMGDDRVVEPYFDLPYVHTESDWGMRKKNRGEDGGSYRGILPSKVIKTWINYISPR